MRDIDLYAKDYKEAPFEKVMVEIRRKTVIKNILKYRHHNILEIGCGLSPLFLHFNDYQSMTVVEPSRDFFQNALTKSLNDTRINCYHGYAEEYAKSVSNPKFDFIILSGVLHEVEDPLSFLFEIKPLCSVQSVIHINVPNAFSLHRILGKEMGKISSVSEVSTFGKKMQVNNVFSLESLKKLLETSGFSIIDDSSYFIKPFTHQQMQLCITNGIITEEVLQGLCNLESHLPGMGAEIYANCVLAK